jgi:hypothetical protein
MKDLIAICGLDCEMCEARIATVTNNEELRKKVAKAWSKLNGVDITPEMIHCVGCRKTGCKTPFCESMCPIRKCAQKRKLETCGECSQLEKCETIQMITSHNAQALENLKK